jgi:hypothetical protein
MDSFNLNEDIAVVSNLVDQNGSAPSYIDNKLIISLVNIEKDGIQSSFSINPTTLPRTGIKKFPPIHLNLLVMISACFSGKKYSEALKFLSYAIYFFQRNPIFDHCNTPDLDTAIDKLILEIENIEFKDYSSVWSVISSKYMPSILYRIRMLTIDSDTVSARIPLLQNITVKGESIG